MLFAHRWQAGYARISVANPRAKGKADSVQALLRSFVNFDKGAGKLSMHKESSAIPQGPDKAERLC